MPEELSAEKISRYKASLKGQRANFDSYYQTLHDYFYVEAENINRSYYPGTELDFIYLLDATSLDLPDIMAAGIMNYLTPSSSRWFTLEHPDRVLNANKEVRQWNQDVADELAYVLNRSNFYNQMPIFYKSSGVYGTATLMIEDDLQDDLRFYSMPISQTHLTEDAREKPLEHFFTFEYTAEQAYMKFGDKVEESIKDACKNQRNPDKKYTFLYYLGPRRVIEYGKLDKMNMPYRGVWVEESTKKVMLEDGYNSMPAVTHRFYKRPMIPYGFSPAMKALPWVRMLNTMADTVLRAAMKHTDPPMAVPDSGFLAPMNFNPRAQNYYKKGKLDPTKDIVPIGNYGKPNVGLEEIRYYAEQAGNMFYKNAFLSFQDVTKQMTVPEVMQRANESLTLLGPAVGRYMSDVLQPLVETAIGKLYRQGRLPRIPDIMLESGDVSYDIKFVGRLAQAQKQSEMNNMTNALTIASQIAQYKPEVLDKIDGDVAIDELWGITNAPVGMIYDNEEVQEIRAARAKQQEMIAKMQMAQSLGQTGKDFAQAEKSAAEAREVGAR